MGLWLGAQLLCGSFILFTLQSNGQIICPLAGKLGQVQQARGCTAQDVHASHKMFACPSCFTHPTRSVHTRLSMCPSAPHFCPATVTIPHRQGRCAPPTSSNPWPQHPLHRAVISVWLAWPLLDLFVCLPRALFVCCLPAELFSAELFSLWAGLLHSWIASHSLASLQKLPGSPDKSPAQPGPFLSAEVRVLRRPELPHHLTEAPVEFL